MSNIKKKINGKWAVLASGKATGISVVNPKLLPPDEVVTSVDAVLEQHHDDIAKLQRNVAWLALHGGGGSGSGGGTGGSGITEATTVITVNGQLTGTQVMVDQNGLTIELTGLSIEAPKLWNVIVRVGVTQIAYRTASFSSPTITIPLSDIQRYLINHAGNLYVGASYEDEGKGIYGSASWQGQIVENVVNITAPNYSFTFENIGAAQIVYNYSVGIVGNYELSLTVKKDGVNYTEKKYEVTIPSTSQQTKAISVEELLNINDSTDQTQAVGVYNIDALLYKVDDNRVSGTHASTITLVSDRILVSTTKMSTDANKPLEVSLSSSINVVFTAYLQGASTFKYKYYIDNQLVKDSTIGYFGQEISDFIPIGTASWAVLDATVPLRIEITSGDKSSTVVYYIKFVAASSTFLEISDTGKSHMISEFLSRDYSNGANYFALSTNVYNNGGVTGTITSRLRVLNENNLSAITVLDSGQPYLRLSNGAYAILDNWTFNGRSYTLPNLLTTKAFTISICFKADYHPDDDRTILYCGRVSANDGSMISGISIDVHDVYINNESKVKLTDNVVNMLDITCIETTVEDVVNGQPVESIEYIVKIYLDGVLTSVSREKSFLGLGDIVYLGGRIYNGPDGVQRQEYLCDCNIYNVQLYDQALSDLDIVTNYINNKVSTTYYNGNPNFGIIDQELKTNFCERNENGKVKSYLYTDTGYSINFLLNGAQKLDEGNLNNFAKVLGIPIMLIDVSTFPSWTFNNFVTQQTAGNVSLDPAEGVSIQYWDPEGSNTSVIEVKDVVIELQGTSTLADAVKNLNITVPNTTAFIPKSHWLPEQTYTLKADVVDSSHSNNASIGRFINEVLGYNESDGSSYCPFDATAISNVYSSNYKKTQQPTATLKHTVEGFPILLIMKFNVPESGESTVSVTSLGIYSFNLGRNAYRNLGFRKLDSIVDTATNEKPVISTFPYILEGATFNDVDSNANWIEIKDTTSLEDLVDFEDSLPSDFNSAKGDFWQNDDSILNARYEVRFPANRQTSEYTSFKRFVSNIMQLPIEGTYNTDSLGNVTTPQVSDSFDLYTVDSSNNYSKTGKKQTIVSNANDLSDDLGFNEESVYKYFTVAMLFGLIDNFGKNSTYRSWNNGQYYVDFYDLDCALGGGNQGQLDITPDVWLKYLANKTVADKKYGYVGETFNIKKADSGTVVSANHNKLWLSMDTAFYRGYRNNISVSSAYTQQWNALRNYLQALVKDTMYDNFADYFIDNYYTKQVASVGPLLFNYDYKLKYLLQFTDESYRNTKDLTKLHGRKVAYARDWLKKHILFLDSLYYWRDSRQTMNYKNNVNTRASNTVYNTPDAFPMKSNTSIIMYNSVGNTVQTFYFMPRNTTTFVNAGANSSNSALNWNFSNSPNIIEFGNTEYPLSMMSIGSLSHAASESALDTEGYPAITELNLANNANFQSGFSLDSFEKGEVSEVRVLDFHNTKGASFSLALNKTTSGGSKYTKYTKLTHIDISESKCISNLSIPDVPLTELKVHHSTLTNLNLIGQKYLPEIDLTGCDNLLTINVQECNEFDSFEITNLNNLETVQILNCTNMTSIVIKGCPNLKVIDIANCGKLKSIVITGCSNLTGSGSSYLNISECGALTSLDLSDNINLTKFKITKSNQANITSLHLHNTKITYIEGDDAATTLLDLYGFTNLKDFTIYGNSEVQKIQFANNKGQWITINKTFQGCDNLERIYGNILFTNAGYSGTAGSFNGCRKFSIHGSSTTFAGKPIASNGIIRTPWDICSAGGADNRGDAYNSVTLDNLFQAGKAVTNIKWNNVGGQLVNTFRNTACTQFDVYYVFATLALSGVKANQGMSYTFYPMVSPVFNWSNGNQPNRYTFYKCSMITSISNAIYTTLTFLYSPEDGKDNGVLSPLTNLTSIGNGFSGGLVFSKNLFKRTSGTSPFSSMSDQSVVAVVSEDTGFSDYSNYSNSSWLLSNISKVGDFSGLFESTPMLSTINGTYNCVYVNFNTIRFGSYVANVRNSFKCTYGTGAIDLEVLFPASSQCTDLSNSFMVNGTLAVFGEKATFPIRSTLFSHITNVQYVGYNPYHYAGGSATSTSFQGSGLRKYIEDDTFPESIVSNCRSLKIFAGFFREVEAKSFGTTPSIPGNMFKNNTNLEDVSALMYNAEFAFKLSGGGFANCPNLKNVAYFCYHSVSTSSRSKMVGQIPYKLFYHGHSIASVTVEGTNQDAEPDSSFDLSTLQSTTITYNNYNKNIINAYRAFFGCVNIEPYEGTTDYIEANPDYSPFKWIYNRAAKAWSEGTDTYAEEGSWGYNGLPSTKVSGKKYLEENVSLVTSGTVSGKSEVLNYCCAPDLLRYCTDSSATNVAGLFEECGLNYPSSGNVATNETIYSVGMQGRIPPYLLKPVSSTTSVQGIFKNCKKLSSYVKDGGTVYQVPEKFFTYATKVTNLVEAFQGLSFVANTSLSVFNALNNPLDIRKIFAIGIYNGVTIQGIFNSNTLSKVSGAFSYNDLTLNTDALGVAFAEHRTISATNATATNNFPTGAGKMPATANMGYVYYGWGSKATDVAIPNTNQNY